MTNFGLNGYVNMLLIRGGELVNPYKIREYVNNKDYEITNRNIGSSKLRGP